MSPLVCSPCIALAGASTERLESLLGAENPVVRAMPNTPCIVGEGMTVICRGTHATADHLARAVEEAARIAANLGPPAAKAPEPPAPHRTGH
jgi:pyrroline-5-carboxylate reductase